MSETTASIRERVWTDDKATGFYDTFIYEPSNADERALGSLVIVGALKSSPSSENEAFLLNSVAALTRRSFYNPPSSSDSLGALEYSLRQVNALLGKQAEQGDLDWFGNLHIAVCCIHDSDVHVAHAGNPDVLLVRNGKAHNIASVTEPNDEPDNSSAHLRVFSAIASGKLEEEDLLLIGAPSLPGDASSIIDATNNPGQDFFKTLHESAALHSYACILIDTRIDRIESNPSFIDTLEKGFSQENVATADPLDLSEIVNTHSSEEGSSSHDAAPLIVEPEEEMMIDSSAQTQSADEQEEESGKIAQFTSNFSRPSLPSLNFSSTKKTIATSARGTAKLAHSTHKAALKAARTYPFNIASMGALLGFLLLFITVNTAMNAPELSLEQETSSLSPLAGIITTITPSPLADVKENPFSFTPSGIVATTQEQILYSNSSGSLYRITPEGEAQFILFAANNGFIDAIRIDETVLLLGHDGAIYRYGSDQRAPVALPLSYEMHRIIDIDSYADSLYILRDDGAIYRYTPNENSYVETVWSASTVESPISMAIDGSIFVADNIGTISQYHRGSFVGTIPLEDKAGESITLYTSKDSPSLVALNTQSNIATVINKESLEDQHYQLLPSSFITGATYNDSEEILYVLSGSNISTIQLNQ